MALMPSTWFSARELTNAAKWYGRLWQPVSDYLIGKLGDQSWIAPTLLNSWSNAAGYAPAGYRIRDGVLYLRGAVTGGTVNPIFVLPTGYRPTTLTLFAVPADPGVARIDIDGSGNVALVFYGGSGTNTLVTLDTLIFPLW